jgi:MFS family permease
MAVLGAGLSLNSTATQIYLQAETPDHSRGRLMTLYTMIWRGAPLLGIAFLGFVTARLGYDVLPVGAMVLTVVGSALIALAIRDLNDVSRAGKRHGVRDPAFLERDVACLTVVARQSHATGGFFRARRRPRNPWP